MQIRKARLEDAAEISRVVRDAIKHIKKGYYTKRQTDAWLAYNTTKIVRQKMQKKKSYRILAVLDRKIVGSASIKIKKETIGSLYIHHKAQGKHIGKKLLLYLENYARKQGITRLKTEATLNAVGFYKKQGYKKIRNWFSVMNGVKCPGVLMSKSLSTKK